MLLVLVLVNHRLVKNKFINYISNIITKLYSFYTMPRGKPVRTQVNPIRRDANKRVAKSTKTEAEKKLNQIKSDIEKQAEEYLKATPTKKSAKEELAALREKVTTKVTSSRTTKIKTKKFYAKTATELQLVEYINEIVAESEDAKEAFEEFIAVRPNEADFNNKYKRITTLLSRLAER